MKLPNKKKPRSGQLQGKDGHLLGVNNGHCSQFQYTTLQELDKDVQQFGRELQQFRAVTLEPRVCVYGISASVPFSGREDR
jgi:hypothetical protein